MKRIMHLVVAVAIATLFGAGLSYAESSKAAPKFDTKPGPAYKMVDGKVSKIDGDIYVVEDYTGNEVKLYVGKDTKKIKGAKKVGDTIRAEMTRGGFANSIQ